MAGEPFTLNVVPKTIGDDPQDLKDWIYRVALELEKNVQTDITASNGVVLVGTDIQHADTSEIEDQDTSGPQVVDTITFDTFGHVLSFTTRNLTASDIGAEPSFTKNTAFNKNFGTTAGTVLEGRTFGTMADQNSNAVSITGGVISGITDLAIADGGTGASNAADARTNLNVDVAGTDNSTDVTLAGTPNYITIIGQVITRALINLTSHVTGILPVLNGGTGSSTASGARSNLGLGSIATQDANAVALTGGNIDGTVIGATTTAAISGTTGDFSGNITGAGTNITSNPSSGGNGQVNATRTGGASMEMQAQASFGIIGTSTNNNVRLKRNNTVLIEMNGNGDWTPIFNNTSDLGGFSNEWARIHGVLGFFSGAVSVGGNFTVTSGNEVFLNLPTVGTGTSGSLWSNAGNVEVVP